MRIATQIPSNTTRRYARSVAELTRLSKVEEVVQIVSQSLVGELGEFRR
jgi:hypothetical protein